MVSSCPVVKCVHNESKLTEEVYVILWIEDGGVSRCNVSSRIELESALLRNLSFALSNVFSLEQELSVEIAHVDRV